MGFRLRSLAWLCASLMLWTAAAESTHIHPSPTEAASCTICVAAHTATPSATVSDRAPEFVAVGLSHQEEATAKSQFTVFDRGIRGPPAVL